VKSNFVPYQFTWQIYIIVINRTFDITKKTGVVSLQLNYLIILRIKKQVFLTMLIDIREIILFFMFYRKKSYKNYIICIIKF